MTPRKDSFARRQPPIRPVLDASFLLMQRSTTLRSLNLRGHIFPALKKSPASQYIVFFENSKRKSIKTYRFLKIFLIPFFFRQMPRKEAAIFVEQTTSIAFLRRTGYNSQTAHCGGDEEKMGGCIMYRDLTKGNITKGLLLFALPMIAGNLLQQFYNIADTLIVGQALGKKRAGGGGLCVYAHDVSHVRVPRAFDGRGGAVFDLSREKGHGVS